MMPSFNKITIVGHAGRDAELRKTPSGSTNASFSIATTEKRGDSEQTTWFNATAWGKTAEIAAQYVQKGKLIYIEGRLSQREYKAQDGSMKTSLDVNVTELKLIGGKQEDLPKAAFSSGGYNSGTAATVNDIPF
jgi:single-strand DNA-binding protein